MEEAMFRRLLVVVGVAATSGCVTFQPLEETEQVGAGAQLRLTFDEPRDFFAASDTASYQLRGLVGLSGEVESVRSDTLVLRGVDFRSGVRQPNVPRTALVSVVPGSSTRLVARRFDAERTVLFVLVASVLTSTALGFNESFWGN
jgi:hypothetical protein